MDIGDLEKKIEWLEREHRRDRATINDLVEKQAASEGTIALLQNQIKELGGDLLRYKTTGSRLDQFDSMVSQYRSEVTKSIDEVEKRRIKHERDLEDRRRMELDVLNKSLIELRTAVEPIADMRRAIRERIEEDLKITRMVGDLDKKFEQYTVADEDIRRSVRSVDEARRFDLKRLGDIQSEMTTLRKRTDDAREKTELNSDTVHQLDNRINELISSEIDRRTAQIAFIEQQSLATVERDRTWKEIQSRFESFIKQNSNIDQQLIAIEDTHRVVKKALETFDDLNTRIERRINEITEIQRLAEERFRQEWVTMKSDDQKRWTNYTLTQDEWVKDFRIELEKLSQRIVSLDDVTISLQDLFQQTSEVTENQMQSLMNWTHEFLTNTERISGRTRPNR